MAEEENNEPKKRGGLVKILLFAFGGIALIGIGLGVGFVLFGSAQPDPSEEIEQIIERKMEEADAKKLAEEEAEKGDGKVVKETPEVETFVTTYFEFPGTFTTNLLESPGNFCKSVWACQHNMMTPSWAMSKDISLRATLRNIKHYE